MSASDNVQVMTSKLLPLSTAKQYKVDIEDMYTGWLQLAKVKLTADPARGASTSMFSSVCF